MVKNNNITFTCLPSLSSSSLKREIHHPITKRALRLYYRNHYKFISLLLKQWLVEHPTIVPKVTINLTMNPPVITTTYSNIIITTVESINTNSTLTTSVYITSTCYKYIYITFFTISFWCIFIFRCVLYIRGLCYCTKSGSFPWIEIPLDHSPKWDSP